jgi:hypothetical protein
MSPSELLSLDLLSVFVPQRHPTCTKHAPKRHKAIAGRRLRDETMFHNVKKHLTKLNCLGHHTNVSTNDARPQPSPQQSEDNISVKRSKGGFRNPLSRSKSIRRDSNSKSKPLDKPSLDHPPNTAPLQANWQGSQEMLGPQGGNTRRGKSAERAVASESDENNMAAKKKQPKDKISGVFVSGSKNVMSKAVSGGGSLLNRLGKMGRSTSSSEREIPDSEYKLKIINKPLVEQTRITRISKTADSCRDKTEFWMPSLPWRCIE